MMKKIGRGLTTYVKHSTRRKREHQFAQQHVDG